MVPPRDPQTVGERNLNSENMRFLVAEMVTAPEADLWLQEHIHDVMILAPEVGKVGTSTKIFSGLMVDSTTVPEDESVEASAEIASELMVDSILVPKAERVEASVETVTKPQQSTLYAFEVIVLSMIEDLVMKKPTSTPPTIDARGPDVDKLVPGLASGRQLLDDTTIEMSDALQFGPLHRLLVIIAVTP